MAVPATNEYGVAIGVLITAIGAQWKAYRSDDQRGRDQLIKALETVHDATTTVAALIADAKTRDEEARRFTAALLARFDHLETKIDAMEKHLREAG